MPAERHEAGAPTEQELRGLAQLMAQPPFGFAFFAGQLAAYVRQRCPHPAEGLPAVQLLLHDGEILDLCHVIGLTPAWVALAVYEPDGAARDRPMRTELVPYASILRVTIRAAHPGGARVGFVDARQLPASAEAVPPAESPEDALRRASAPVEPPQIAPGRHEAAGLRRAGGS